MSSIGGVGTDLKGARMEEKNKEQTRADDARLQELPSFDDLVQRFSLFSASPLCNTQIGTRGSLHCECEGCFQWHAFVEGRSPECKEVQYEVFTLEHVKGLASYLLVVVVKTPDLHVSWSQFGTAVKMQAAQYKLPLMKVLEVGAGSGRLCHYLDYFLSQSSLASQGRVVQFTATDSGERGLNGPTVVKRAAIEAISEAMPHVVLVSWMPIGVDWTAHMRATPSVLEYILIGETDSGICGDPWLTWGYFETEDYSDNSSYDLASLRMSDGPFKSNTFSNYGPGRPVDIVQIETKFIPSPSTSQRGSQSRQEYPPTVVGWRGRVEEMLVGSAQYPKRLRLVPESLRKSSSSGDLCAAVRRPISPRALTRIDDTHHNLGLQIPSDRKNSVLSPPYRADGWARTELTALSSLQICRTDERWSTRRHSHTVSFRRCISSILQHDITELVEGCFG